MLQRALKVIPNGTGTFSKSRTLYPVGASPLYIKHGRGANVWDVDGNEYLDFVSSLCPIILGHCDRDVDMAVHDQMSDGVVFTLPHPLEIEVAEMLCEVIPCAEMVRFAKNGSDATSGAIRLARAYTGRDLVVCCGYHGWQDWYIGITPRNAGVPQAVRSLTHKFEYNDIDSLHAIFKQYPNQVACVIMEPMSSVWPEDGFLQKVKELTHKNHALLIFDEVITGFRWSLGGAQQFFNVIPDLACFGKAMANGYPLSAVVGKADIMKTFEKVHFSFTNSGECLSLVACKSTITKLKDKLALNYIYELGLYLKQLYPDLHGHPARLFIRFPNDTGKAKLLQELFARGILMIETHNLTYSHTRKDIDKLIAAYTDIFAHWDEIELKVKPTRSDFKIR